MNTFPKVSVVTTTYNDIENLKRILAEVKKQTYPNIEHIIVDGGSTDGTVDLLKELEENENGFFLKKHLKYFGTLSDRADRLMSRTVHLLEYAQQVKEAYQAQIDARQNSNMQFLTVLSTIFFPLTLITGWFGMNFKDMPGLENGYPAVMALSIVIIVICILIFKKKKII